jgi:hypothetical protein
MAVRRDVEPTLVVREHRPGEVRFCHRLRLGDVGRHELDRRRAAHVATLMLPDQRIRDDRAAGEQEHRGQRREGLLHRRGATAYRRE